MSTRSQRIARIVLLRNNELKQTVVRLQDASCQHTQCRQAHAQAQSACEQAIVARRALTNQSVDVLTYLEAQEWILSLQAREALAAQHLHQAALELQKHQALTNRARTKVKQLEHLQEQLKSKERRAEVLAERVLDDEISQRIFRNNR